MSLVPSFVGRVLAALGFGIITVTGLTVIQTNLETYLTSAVGGMPADMYVFANLAGMITGLNIVVGSMTSRIALYVLTRSSKIIGVPGA